MRTDLPYWTELWGALHAQGSALGWHSRLSTAYADPSRHYHNLQHLDECLVELDAARPLAQQPAIVEIALWFHDAIYDPRSASNEETSADLADECLVAAALSRESVDTVRELIICTKTHRPGSVADASLLIDIDLAILGQPPERFWNYERAIKAEYAWAPEAIYREKRSAILTSFLERPTIFATAQFRSKYEAAARVNLAAAIQRLQAPSL